MRDVRLPTRFSERRNILAGVLVATNLAIVAGSGIVAYRLDSPLIWAVAFLLVGARGQACYILQHEAMHNLLFSNRRLNENTGVLLSAFLGTKFHAGRALHMKHHREVGNANDPNMVWHGAENKQPKGQFIRFILFQALGGRLVMLVLSLFGSTLSAAGLRAPGQAPALARAGDLPARLSRIDLAAFAVVQLAMFALFATTAVWWLYFALYVIPLSTVTALLEALRSFSEHVLPGTATNDAERHRRFYMNAGPVERFLISQFGFHYHHVHHLFVNVPTFNVKAAHTWLHENAPDFRDTYIERPGYIGTAILYYLKRPFPGRGA